MLKIRLEKVGRKHEPVFRLVLTDSKNAAKSGKYLEMLGSYDSRHGEQAVFNAERITHWISKGAQVSGTVNNLLIDKKIISGKKINVLPKKKPILKEAPATEAPAQPAAETKAEVAPESEAPAEPTEAPAPEAPKEEAVA